MASPVVASSVVSAIGSSTERALNAHATRDAGDLLPFGLYQAIGAGRTNEPITDADFSRIGSVIYGENQITLYTRIATDDAADNIACGWGGTSIFNFIVGARVTGNATNQHIARQGEAATGSGTKIVLPGFTLPAGRDYTVFAFRNTGGAVTITEPGGYTQVTDGFFAYEEFPDGGTVPDYEATLSGSTEWGGFLFAVANEYTPPAEEVEPVVIGTKETTVGSNATSITGALPNGCDVAGRRVLAEGIKDGNGAITWPAGWHRLYDGVDGDNLNRVEIRYRDLQGSEFPAEGATLKLEGASEHWVLRSWLIEEGTFDWEQPPAIDSARLGEGNANPPNVRAPWGEAMALWIAGCAVDSAATQAAPSAYPTNYSLDQYGVVTSATADSVIYGSAARKLKAAQENPGAFTNRSDGNVAWTVAIKGAVVGAEEPEFDPPLAWDLSLDSGMNDGEGAKSFLGVLQGEPYLFGSSGESAGDMAGIHRFRDGEWEQLDEGGGEDFNGLGPYGAIAYKGKLYVGDRRKGRLYRLDLDGDGDFEALTSVGGEAFVGSEDVFCGPVLWGRLYLGTFGNAFNPGLGLEPPGIYRFNGTAVTQILELEDIEIGGEVSSFTYFEDKLWASAVNADRDYCEIWTVEDDDTTALVYSGSTIYTLAVLNGQLVAATLENEEKAPGAESAFVVWDGSGFDPLAGPWSVQVGSEFCRVVGSELWGSDYYYGITVFDGEDTENIGMGAWREDPLDQSPTSESFGGAMCVKVTGGYVWVTTQQPCKVWRVETEAEDDEPPASESGARSGAMMGVGQ